MTIKRLILKVNERSYSMVMNLDVDLPMERTIDGYISNGRLYEPEVSAAITRMVAPGDVVVDVGANVGFFSLLMGLLVGAEGRVVCFEPADNNIPRLIANIGLTNLDNVVLIERPASSAAKDVLFYINSDNSGGNALWDPGQFPGNLLSQSNPKSIKTRATTIDEEVERLKLPTPKLIKVDTEGAEHQVLQGAQHLLENHKVPYVIAELHEFGLAKMNSSQMDLRRFMEGFGYDTFAMYHSGCLPKLIPRGTRVASRYIINILFSTPDNVGRLWDFDWFDPATSPTPPEAT